MRAALPSSTARCCCNCNARPLPPPQYIVEPLYNALARVESVQVRECTEQLSTNTRVWQDKLADNKRRADERRVSSSAIPPAVGGGAVEMVKNPQGAREPPVQR